MGIVISKDQPTDYFVYGTLRVGAAEWGRSGYVAPPVTGCTAKGDLYNYGFAFPYADFDGEGTIQGDIITLTPLMAARIQHVEEGAGYEAREVLVTMPGGETRVVVGWQIKESTKQRTVLDKIPSGDWLVCVQEETRRYARR